MGRAINALLSRVRAHRPEHRALSESEKLMSIEAQLRYCFVMGDITSGLSSEKPGSYQCKMREVRRMLDSQRRNTL